MEEELDFIINYDIKRGRGGRTLSPIPHTQNKKQCNFTFQTRDIIEDFTSGLHKPTMNELQFILYNTPEGNQSVQVVVKDETLWCTQKAMAQLFGVGVPAISKHLNHIFEEGELNADVVVSKMEIATQHGAIDGKTQTHDVAFYSLDAIIAVGYRVSSLKATRFRQWATKVLNEYIKKGFVMDDERLKQGKTVFGKDYFRELLERIRSIRASERRIWQQITDIYAECSIDYDPRSTTTREFYQMVQNRFHYAITGKTAPEIIYTSADHTKEHMGL